ncbi:MAG: dTDP-4-dehydrorhamnose 3,5-epimerase [Candidatus Latescibacteria bacterium]|nr:dTDP-4-dehydrorhamnose 3,5-epimerase [Candidatus Latescibacterota bacterium]
MPFSFSRLQIPDLVLIEPGVFPDERGFFLETYKASDFAAQGIDENFVQTNYSRSTQGVLRGLHYQKNPAAQGKLVMVTAGQIFDVGVDIRRGSPTYGRWAGVVLSAADHRMLYLPPGFAHGFCVLSEQADFVYQMTAEYDPQCDSGIIWNDADIGVEWPLQAPLVSAKDAELPTLAEADHDFVWQG